MSSPSAGGATVFSELNLTLYPTKVIAKINDLITYMLKIIVIYTNFQPNNTFHNQYVMKHWVPASSPLSAREANSYGT